MSKVQFGGVKLINISQGSVLGHGNIVWPPVWQDANGTFGLKSGQTFTNCDALLI